MSQCYVVIGGVMYNGRRMHAQCESQNVTAFFCSAFSHLGSSALLGSAIERQALLQDGVH